MLKFYQFIGKVFFPRAQTWEQVKNARTMTYVILFSMGLALIIAVVIEVANNHPH